MTTGITIALTRQTSVGKVMSLLFNMLSRLVITFLPRSKCLNFMAAITICSDFGAPKNKVWHCFHCLLEFAQVHVHWVGNAIQPPHPLSSLLLCLQSFPASGSSPESRLFASGGQSIGVSVPSSTLPMNIQGWFPLGLTGLISLQSKGLSRVFSSSTTQKQKFFGAQPSLCPTLTWLMENHSSDYTDLCQQSAF